MADIRFIYGIQDCLVKIIITFIFKEYLGKFLAQNIFFFEPQDVGGRCIKGNDQAAEVDGHHPITHVFKDVFVDDGFLFHLLLILLYLYLPGIQGGAQNIIQ